MHTLETRAELARVCNEVLIAQLHELITRDRRVTVRLLVHLDEIDRRGLYRDQAYSSMFDYCVAGLHMSEAEAFTRLRAARLSRDFPVVLDMVARGELHLSGIKLLAPLLTQANHTALLAAARFKTKREIEKLLASYSAKADVASVIRKLPQPRPAGENASDSAPALPLALAHSQDSAMTSDPTSRADSTHAPSLQSRPNHRVSPLSTERYKVQFTASEQLTRKLRQAQDLMRHQVPDGDLAAICERAIDLLIAERMKERFATGSKAGLGRSKTASSKAVGGRHIPHAVRRDVLARDGARCTFVADDGRRCTEHGHLEFHHDEPHGRGGPATLDNIRLLCRAHNQLLAERDYGRDLVRRHVARAQTQRTRTPVPEQVGSAAQGSTILALDL